MKKTFFIVCLLSVVMFSNICYADTYQVDIVGINKKVIIEKVANDMVSTNGFMISNINDYQAIFRKDMNAFTDRLLYGSNYNRTPEYRLICNFTMNGTVVKVTMEPKTVTNPGGAYESYTPIKDGTLLGYLNGLNHYFNSYIDTGITWNPKKKGDLVEILSIAKRSSAEKAGIVAGDMIAKVDGILVKDISMERFLIMMSGPEGKSTSLTLHRANGDTVITVTRSLIPAEYQP